MENNESFEYTYSAPEQEEIRRIREKYLPKNEQEEKMAKLRSLDASVTEKATVYSLILGILSTLVFGTGMCCCLVWTELFVLGIFVGLLGMAGMALAYPLYKRTVEKERARVAPEILKLTEDLM